MAELFSSGGLNLGSTDQNLGALLLAYDSSGNSMAQIMSSSGDLSYQATSSQGSLMSLRPDSTSVVFGAAVTFTTVTAGTLLMAAGSITDSSGAISFGNENLVTTGRFGSGSLTANGNITNVTGTTKLAGNVGIGDNPGTSALRVEEATAGVPVVNFRQSNASTPNGLFLTMFNAAPNDTTQYFFRMEDSGGLQAVIYTSGSYEGAANSYGGLSDRRLKIPSSIDSMESNWDLYKRLGWSHFRMRRTPEKAQRGLIAQDAQKLFPHCVYESEDGMLAINYMGIATETGRVVVEAIGRIESSEQKITRLTKRVAKLERLVA